MPSTETICFCGLFTTPWKPSVIGTGRFYIHGAFPLDRRTCFSKKNSVFLTSGAEGGGSITRSSILSDIAALWHLLWTMFYFLKPNGRRTTSICGEATLFLGAGVETNIRSDRVWHLIFIWHCESEGSARPYRKWRRVRLEPLGVGLAGMRLAFVL